MQLDYHGDFPLMRSSNDRRFRLIDFGRGKSLKDAIEADRLQGDEKNTEQEIWHRKQTDEKSEIKRTLEFPQPLIDKNVKPNI